MSQGMTSPIMNFGQPFAYIPQTPQGQMCQQVPSVPPSIPPPWANELIQDMKSLKQSLPKIENIEKTVNRISAKVSEIEVKLNTIETRVDAVEQSCSFINSEAELQKNELKEAKKEIHTLHKACRNLETSVKQHEAEREKMDDKLNDLEARSMRENLMFYGLKEDSEEDCSEKVKVFCQDNLEIDASNMTFDRAHRIGNNTAKKPRPIVVKFHYYSEREKVRKAGFDKREQLKERKVGVGIQQPKQVRDARKELYSVKKAEAEKGNDTKFVGKKLYINGQLYVGKNATTQNY
ncbi:uncharacterized protein LOC123556557 [Mercenaria mercenaria]|uniref:uncharacterized protein LOC123556557 n=1 Tax=Mercenaria mercenaria TaxID=6596 RepID=UPI00234F03C0|nr:uncharacterized protein LOC123556557 [Mercenaria mercenaria]XP_053398800.1 uncharacterized protein LOC123556557 [Mercenaria mercenaria]